MLSNTTLVSLVFLCWMHDFLDDAGRAIDSGCRNRGFLVRGLARSFAQLGPANSASTCEQVTYKLCRLHCTSVRPFVGVACWTANRQLHSATPQTF